MKTKDWWIITAVIYLIMMLIGAADHNFLATCCAFGAAFNAGACWYLVTSGWKGDK